jgi:hypothetical protein
MNELKSSTTIEQKEKYGREYFEGSEKEITSIVLEIQRKYRNSQPEYKNDSQPEYKFDSSKTCKFCLKIFKSNQGLFRHKNCIEKNDEIRSLELKLGIFVNEIHSHKCRFCDYSSVCTSNVIRHLAACKAKKEYQDHLHKIIREKYEWLPIRIKKKYESICENDEMNIAKNILLKLDLYNNYKSGKSIL